MFFYNVLYDQRKGKFKLTLGSIISMLVLGIDHNRGEGLMVDTIPISMFSIFDQSEWLLPHTAP